MEWDWGRRSVRGRHHRGLPVLSQPVALAVHPEDVDVVCQPVEQRIGESHRSEHLGPLVERQVGDNDDRAARQIRQAMTDSKVTGLLSRLPRTFPKGSVVNFHQVGTYSQRGLPMTQVLTKV